MDAITPRHQLLCVAPDHIMDMWPLVRDMIDDGYAACGAITPPELPQWLSDGKGQLWLSIENDIILAALTTSIVPLRNGCALKMVACGGNRLELWKDCHKQIEEFAQAEGCDRVQIREGRPAWSRVLGREGYNVTHVTLEKRL